MTAFPTKAKTFLKPEQVNEDLRFTEATLDSSMIEQPSLFAHYAVIASNAQHHYETLKTLLEVREAKVGKMARDSMTDAGIKVTEGLIATEVAMNQGVVEHKLEVNAARAQWELAKATLEAFKQRRDMLQQMAAARREEMLGAMRIKAIEIEGDKRTSSAKSAGAAAVEALNARNDAA